MTDLATENARLRALVEGLEFKIDEMRGSERQWVALSTRFGVSRKVAITLAFLSSGRTVSADQVLMAVDSPDATIGAARTLIKFARKADPSIVIKATYSGGYQMNRDGCDLVKSAMNRT